MTTLDLHLQRLSELKGYDIDDLFLDPFQQRDSEDGHEDTSIPAPVTGGGGTNTHPLQLVSSGDLQTLYVRFGTVSGLIPTISAVPLAVDFTSNILAFTATGTTNFYLEVTITVTDGISEINSVSIETSTTSDDEFYSSRLLGSVTASSGDITGVSNALQGSQNVDSCGPLHSWNLV